MRFCKPAETQPCYYCEKIETVEQEGGYPIRDGIYTFENYIFRCAWHARFTCSKCGTQHHFDWFHWCPSTEELVCGDCRKPTLKPVAFWDRTYAYEFYCDECDDYHLDLLYAEFQGAHPWQLGNRTIVSNIESQEPWTPLWSPKAIRTGEDIELIEALKLPNRIVELREDLKYTLFRVLRHAVPEDEIDRSETQESWEANAEDYADLTQIDMTGDPNRQFIIDPALWSLVGDVSGLSVLDAGCGHGYLTRVLATKGAKAVGVDFSGPFIHYCTRVESEMNLGCKFYRASITDMHELASKSFDIVVSNIVMGDVLDYKSAFKEIARVLKDDGRFIWSNVHPVFGRTAGAIDVRFPRDSQRGESRYLKMIDRYFDSGGEQYTWMKSRPSWGFVRTLEEYSKALKDAGFVISEILEPRPTPEVIQQNPREMAFDADRWTHFIIYECVKRL
ncbi:MAG: methyltransferase domain-containing protein [Candidatus Thorarchaeota archaeon]|nr:MAG: methyltransferase domain-containing protein [Candidatus Thorarchaeota archaeon]